MRFLALSRCQQERLIPVGLVALLAWFALTNILAGQAPKAPAKVNPPSAKFFEDKIRPVLANRCFSCHGPEKQKGQLRLDSLAGMLKGGRTGPAVEPGQPDRSLFIRAIQHSEELQMPPKTKLPQLEIALLTTWVKMGAPWPQARPIDPVGKGANGSAFTKQQREFWAFQKPAAPSRVRSPLPQVKNASWVRSPIDWFILAKLEEKGIEPAPPADRLTLIRRATFDLTGLPPTPEEIDTFVQDQSPEALARVIDRLLASPQYGQRWGRHWLDLARYSDSNGMDENLAFGNAYRYRDWVIAAFNQDMPYDQFVRMQIAGDLMPAGGTDGIIATGFLTIGPKMLAEDDPVKMEMDIIDEQVDTLGRTFLGLTLGCARCHDHKFDPLSMADYYALAGIFKSTKTMDNFRVVARWHERPIAGTELQELARHQEKKLAEKREAILKLKAQADALLLARACKDAARYLKAAGELLNQKGELAQPKSILADPKTSRIPGIILVEAEDYTRGNVLKSFDGYGAKIGVIYNRGELPNVAEYDFTLPGEGAYQLELRYAAADSRPVQLRLNNRLIKDGAAGPVTGSWNPDTQTWFVEGVFSFQAGKNTLRLERAEPFPHFDKLALVPVKLPPGVANLIPKTPERLAAEYQLNPVFLRQWAEFLKKAGKLPSGADLEKILHDAKGPLALPANAEAYYPEKLSGGLQALRSELTILEKSRPILPEAMGVSEGSAANLRIHLRGSHLNLGIEVPRRFPVILAGTQQPAIGPKQSGRLELADWITRDDNPLTSRVMVNRIWLYHFGAALVRSPDNFGLLGDRPVHRDLLDWLAVKFVDSGWSIKAMHRLIMLSSTYQMSTAYSEQANQADPENRLHWRMNRRRLEAEAVRDAILAVSGQLDRSLGGSLLVTPNRAYVASTFSVNPTNYDSNRRSVYLPVVRSALYEVLQAFDFADPSVANGERATTTVAPQALFMLNSDLMHNQSRHFAQLLLQQEKLDDAGRLNLLYRRALGRSVTASESDRALGFIKQVQGALPAELPTAERWLRAWQSLCRVVLASNEFVYVE